MDKNERKQPTLAWTIDDVALELKVSVRHIYRLVMRDQIPYVKIGKSLRFSPERIKDWMNKGGTR